MGGALTVAHAGPAPDRADAVVLAIHGIAANLMAWRTVARELTREARLCVLAPDLRGHGYGRALMEHVLEEFRRRGFAEVTLWVLEENWNARRFYEKCGFRLDGGSRTYPRTRVPEVRYRIGLNRG